MEDSLRKRYSIKLLANIVAAIIGAVLVTIVPKALGPVAYGQFIYLQDFFMKIINFLDMGSSMAFFTKLSAKQERKELVTFYFIYSFVILILVILFIFLIERFEYTQKLLPSIPDEYIYMGLLFGFFTWFTQIFIKISDAYALTVSVEIFKIVHKIVSLLLLIYLVNYTFFKLDIYFYFHYMSLVSFLSILLWIFARKGILRDIFTFQVSFSEIAKEFIRYCHPLLLLNISVLIVGFLNIWMLQKYGGSIQTGFYGLAYSFAAICFMFTQAMTPVITREFSKAYGKNDIKKMKKLFYRYAPMLYSMAAYFGVFLSLQGSNVLAIFTDEKFQNASSVLVMMALYPLHQTYGQLSGSIFYATGDTKIYRNITLFTQLLMLGLSYLFIVELDFGAIGLALSMLVVQIVGVNIGLYFNAIFLKLNLKYLIFHQVYSFLFFFILAFLSSSIVCFDLPLVDFLVSGILYTLLVTILAYIFPQVFATTREEIINVAKGIKKYANKSTIADER